MARLFAVCLFFLNFLPLWAVLVFRDVCSLLDDTNKCNRMEWISLIGILCAFVVSVVVVQIGIRQQRSSGICERRTLTQLAEHKTLTADMLLCYVLPLLAFDFSQWRGLVEFLVFFAVLLRLNWKYNTIQGCLWLELFGRRIYSCKFENGEDIELIASSSLSGEEGTEKYLCPLNDKFWIVL